MVVVVVSSSGRRRRRRSWGDEEEEGSVVVVLAETKEEVVAERSSILTSPIRALYSPSSLLLRVLWSLYVLSLQLVVRYVLFIYSNIIYI